MNVLWIGEPGIARQELARRAPQVRVSECAVASAWDVLGSGGVRADLLVVDTTLAGLDVQEFLARRERGRIELPTILLTPTDHDLPDPAGDTAGLDRVVKTDNFVLQLLTSFNLALARYELHAQLRASRKGHDRLRGILDAQPAATCAFGPDGVLTAMNQAGLTMLGATREQVVGQPVSTFVAATDHPAAGALIRRVYEGQPSESVVAILRSDGRRLQVRLRAVPYFHGERLVALASLEEREREAVASTTVPASRDLVDVTLQTVTAERERLATALQQATVEIDQLRAEHGRVLSLLAERQRDMVPPPGEPVRSGDPNPDTRDHEPSGRSDESIELGRQLREPIERAVASNMQLQEEREQLTRALHVLTGRFQEAGADDRELRLAARDAEARHRADALTIAGLQAERDALAGDRKAVLELREALVRALGEADRHCRLLLERQEAALNWCAELNARQRS